MTKASALPLADDWAGTNKRDVRRDEEGRFQESADVGRSLSQDRKQTA